MAVYYSSRCGGCGIDFEFMESRGKIRIGPPILKCRYCETLNKTGWVLPKQSSLWTKFLDISQSIRNVLTALMVVLICFAGYFVLFGRLLGLVEGEFEINPIIPFIMLTGMLYLFGRSLISWYKSLVNRKKNNLSLEKLFEEQGFLWTDQMI